MADLIFTSESGYRYRALEATVVSSHDATEIQCRLVRIPDNHKEELPAWKRSLNRIRQAEARDRVLRKGFSGDVNAYINAYMEH